MKCMVTGGAGFIGSHLVEALLRNGQEVYVFDNFSTGKRENLAGLPVTVIEGDMRDPGRVQSALRGMELVFHLAALSSVTRSVHDPVTTHAVNVTGTLALLEACRKVKVARVVYASSSSVYGDSPALPKQEDMTPSPLSPYAVSKLVGEYYCRMYWQAFGLETVCLRYFNVFGPRQDPASEYAAVIPRFIRAALQREQPVIYGDGTQTRDFTYVEDVARANLAAATRPVAGEVMNVACGGRRSLLELVTSLEKALDADLIPEFRSPRPGDVKHSEASIARAQRLLDYAPRVTFEEGLKRTMAWHRDPTVVERTRSEAIPYDRRRA
jgi:UDP-glucose 4-epimerase